MSVCGVNFNPSKEKYIEKYINTKVDIEGSIPFGFSSSVNEKGEIKIYTHGKRNIEENLPFEADSIYRMASQSKFMSVVGFLNFLSKNKSKIDLNSLLKTYIPEFDKDKMGVIDPYQPEDKSEVVLVDKIYLSMDSKYIKIIINHPGHNFQVGDSISIEWNNGSLERAELSLPDIKCTYNDTEKNISAYDIYNIHEINKLTPNGYEIQINKDFDKDINIKDILIKGSVIVRKIEKNVYRSIVLQPDSTYMKPTIKTMYYKLLPLKRDLTILDVINHGLGWSYFTSSIMYMSFGYDEHTIKRDIQAGIWCEIKIPVGYPRNCYKKGIIEWSRSASKIPLLYQPGEDWSYGPQLSLLGSLIEIVDGRKAEIYMREEIWEPLGMIDTGFFLRSEDPKYSEKKERLCMLYANIPKIIWKFMGKKLEFPPIYEIHPCLYEGEQILTLMDSGMFTTVNDYLKFMKMLLNNGKSENGQVILDQEMLHKLKTYQVSHDLSNLVTIDRGSKYIPFAPKYETNINRYRALSNMKWGMGVGTIPGCQYNNSNNKDGETNLAVSWAGVLGTRCLIDFCSGIAYNVGTNVVGPPAGVFDSDIIEIIYKEMTTEDCEQLVNHLLD
jgi:CubicO group peptidase (beta-lactamase class C family)